MMEIKLKDLEFAHTVTGGNGDLKSYKPKNFVWYRGDDYRNITIFTNRQLHEVVNNDSKYKIAWMLEPRVVNEMSYIMISNPQNYTFFNYIFTFDEELLKLDNRFIRVPLAGCWIEDDKCKIYKKEKNMSIIASGKKITVGQQLRHWIVDQFLQDDKEDVYGRGYKEIESKLEGLKDYRFSFIVENYRGENYFSEKLIDCLVTGTIPIYWGATNIGDFFDIDGIITFKDLDDLRRIVPTLNEAEYLKRINNIENNYEISLKYRVTEDCLYRKIKELKLD